LKLQRQTSSNQKHLTPQTGSQEGPESVLQKGFKKNI